MNKKRCVLLITLALTLCLIATSCQSQKVVMNLTTDEKQEDFMFLYNLLKNDYPFFEVKQRTHGVEWLKNEEYYLNRVVNTSDDKSFYNEITEIVSNLNDSHTHIVSPEKFEIYKRYLPSFGDKVSETRKEYFVKPHKAAKKNYEYWNSVFGLTEQDLEKVKQEYEANKEVEFRKYHDDNTMYIGYKSFSSSEENLKLVSDYIRNNIECSNVIIDIRGNGGGSSSQWMKSLVYLLSDKEQYTVDYKWVYRGGEHSDKFVNIMLKGNSIYEKKEISELPKGLNYPLEIDDFSYYLTGKYTYKMPKSLGFKGNIYVLTDNAVYSAAESFAKFCKETGFATLVGQRTKGDGGGLTPILVRLPNSGLIVRMALQLTLNQDGTANAEYGTTPDIEVEAENALEEVLIIIDESN